LWPERASQIITRIASAPDPGAALVGPKAWNRLSDTARNERRAEAAAFLLDITSATEAPYNWDDLPVPYLIGSGASWLQTAPRERRRFLEDRTRKILHTRQQPGCIAYSLSADPIEPDVVRVSNVGRPGAI
jgi:hypothetical protein